MLVFHSERKDICKMDSESSFDRNSVFSSNGITWCDKCNMHVTFQSLNEHIALKHNTVRSESEDDDIDTGECFVKPMVRKTLNLNMYRRMQQTNTKPDNIGIFGPDAKRNGTFNIEKSIGNGSAFADFKDVAESKTKVHRERSVARTEKVLRADQVKSGDIQNRPKIPSVFDLFNIDRSRSETRRPRGTFDAPRRSTSVCEAPLIMDNFDQCKFCLNVMPKDAMKGHVERKHCTTSEPLQNQKQQHNGHVEGNYGQSSKNKSKPNATQTGTEEFVRCKLCCALMHRDYMPGHLVRKHQAEQRDSIGVCWSLYTDDQLSVLLEEKRVSVKNGFLFVDKHEFDE